MPIEITLQYFDGCPNWMTAERELREAIENLDLDAELVYEKIESHAHAEEVRFRGSPTILISGRDPFADPDVPVGLSCLVYRTGTKPSGSPGVESLQNALQLESGELGR